VFMPYIQPVVPLKFNMIIIYREFLCNRAGMKLEIYIQMFANKTFKASVFAIQARIYT